MEMRAIVVGVSITGDGTLREGDGKEMLKSKKN